MNKEFAQIIKFYSQKYPNINEDFIPKIVNLILDNENLSDCIVGMKSEKKFGFFGIGVIAAYDRVNKLIRYNYKKLINKGIKNKKKTFSNVKLSNEQLYLFIIQVLLHEIEHARQFGKIKQITTTEDYILAEELLFVDNAIKELTAGLESDDPDLKIAFDTFDYAGKKRILYEFSPSERFADIYAKEQTYNIAKHLDDFQLQEMMKYDYYQALLRGYHFDNPKYEVTSPTKFFFDYMDKPLVWDEIIQRTTNLEELEKIKLGLEVNRDFFESINQKSNSLILKLKK